MLLRRLGLERVFGFDEGRFGLKVWFRKRWCPLGERPPWVYQDHYEWWWLYAAVEPLTGESLMLLLPWVRWDCLQLFLDEFSKQVAGQRVGLVMDGSGSHRAGAIRWPEGIEQVELPAYSPELNPVERLFEHLRGKLSNRIFESLADLEAAITQQLRVFWDEPALLVSLTGYPWWLHAARSIVPSPT